MARAESHFTGLFTAEVARGRRSAAVPRSDYRLRRAAWPREACTRGSGRPPPRCTRASRIYRTGASQTRRRVAAGTGCRYRRPPAQIHGSGAPSR
eukprot:scaffold5526_cov123-Isochrysis_galbana.AAC.2